MTSRSAKSRIIALSILLIVGCGKDSQNPEDGLNRSVSVGNTECLENAPKRLEGVFSGEAIEADIHEVSACATKVIRDFMAYTQGARPDGYTHAELKGFLEKYYFRGGIPDAVINATLKLKQAFVGGSSDFLTRGEVQRFIDAIGVLDSAAPRLLPVAKILFTDGFKQASEADWLHAHDVLLDFADRIGSFISQVGQEYAFSDLRALLHSWGVYLELPSNHFVFRAAGLVSAIQLAKTMLIAGSQTGVRPDEWQPLLSTICNAYSTYQLFMRLSLSDDVLKLLAEVRLPVLAKRLIDLLDRAVERHADKKISLSAFVKLLEILQDHNVLPVSVNANHVTILMRFLLNKIFTTQGAPSDALSSMTISEMKGLLSAWSRYDSALSNGDFSNAVEFGLAFTPLGAPMSFDGLGRLNLPLNQPNTSGVHHELAILYTVLEWITIKYGNQPISQPVLDTIFADFLDVLHRLNLLLDKDMGFSVKLMRYTNLFMPGSNGDMIIDKGEAFQFGVFLLSSFRAWRELDKFASSCKEDQDCISAYWYQNRGLLFSNFPNLLAWLGNDTARWASLSQNLVQAAGVCKIIDQFVAVHYIETFLARYDHNGDQTIDLNESLSAYPVFQPLLRTLILANGLGESDVKPMFTYLLKYGAPPISMAEKLVYLYWKTFPDSWAYSLDRKALSKALAAVGSL